jgi:hypothetical protein
MMKKIICSLILVTFLTVCVMPERALADGAAQGALIGAAIGLVVAGILAIAAQSTRAKEPEATNKNGEPISVSSASDSGITSKVSFTSSEENTNNDYAIAIRF